jgi:hypothetical protein
VSASPLPTDVDQLDARWFSAVLDRDVNEVVVLDRSSGTTGRARMALQGEDGLPASVFVKLPPFDEQQRALVDHTGMGVAEARFYRDLAQEVGVRVPGVWHADTNGRGYVMVLQWLSERGARGRGGGGRKFIQQAVDVLGDQLDTSFHRIADLYISQADAIVPLWREGAGTLVHGDSHLGNLFVDVGADDRTGFLDWAVLCRAPGMRDVAYTMCNSVPAHLREEIERELVARYCTLLAAEGVVLDPGVAWDQYRLLAVYSWVAATSTAGMGSKWQPISIGLSATKRATAACAHLESVDLIESLLT